MKIVKRDGTTQTLNTNKIMYRLRKLCKDKSIGVLRHIDPDEIAVNVCSSVYDGITSSEIDVISARMAYERYTQHEEFGQLAGRILISNLHKNTHECFSEVMEILNKHVDENGDPAPIISDEFMELIRRHREVLDFMPDYTRDYLFEYFGFKTLEFGYLLRVFEKRVYNQDKDEYEFKFRVVERPQHMWLRVALQAHGDDLGRVRESYELMSQKYFTHATPTLFNSGSPNPQLSSCFLVAMKSDSIDGIYETLKRCAQISKFSGGIGLHIHNVRANGSRIRGTNGRSDGIVPMLRNYNETAKYVNQGSRRKGSFAIYLSPDHADVEDFLDLKLKHGDDSRRARDLFYALWIPDLFMKQVNDDGDWYLMCPDESPGLADVHSEAYEQLYWRYVEEGRYRKKMKARDLYKRILRTQAETGTPYLLFKDTANQKSNQKNLGTIKSSNLCVAPETKILTETGYHEIQSLTDKDVRVWNGKEWSATTVRKTGENQQLLKITFSNGSRLECTPYHKFYIVGGYRNQRSIQVEAKDLKQNMRLIKCDFPIITTGEHLEDANWYGYFFGQCTVDCPVYESCKDSRPVPINFDLDSKIAWFSGLADSRMVSYTARAGVSYKTLQIRCFRSEYLEDLKLMLQTMGVDPSMRSGRRRYKELILTPEDLHSLKNIGFSPKQFVIDEYIPARNTKRFIQVLSVENCSRVSDTYCFTEELRHRGIFNGVITGQCSEIIQYSSPEETAVCNLASLSLPQFVSRADNGMSFDFEKLHTVTKVVARNLDNVIDVNFYPIEEARRSNMRHRPIGIGVQGLADVYMLLKLPFDSEKANELNRKIFETIYHAAIETSCDLAAEKGRYETFDGSPASQGLLQFDLWNVDPGTARYDWPALKKRVVEVGLRNSLSVAPMPTASSSNILGNNEACEPFTSNLYSRKVLSGTYIILNRHLFRELNRLKLWNEDMKNLIMANRGSIQNIPAIPDKVKQLFKTAWEISPRAIIDQAATRGPFICQSQSMNLFIETAGAAVLGSVVNYIHKSGLKGVYYIHSRPAANAIQFTVDQSKIRKQVKPAPAPAEDNEDEVAEVCTMEEGCVSCSS